MINRPSSDLFPPYLTFSQGNIFNLPPLFLDTAAANFRLHPCSPARNAGSNAAVQQQGITTDLDGNPRIQGGTVDMGPYESPAFEVKTAAQILQAPCPGSPASLSLDLSLGCPPYFITLDGDTTIADTAFVTLPVPAGTHQIIVSEGKTESDTITIQVTEPPAFTAISTISPIICGGTAGGSASLSPQGGTPPHDLLWSNGSSDLTLSNLPAGTYAFTLTDANGCLLTDSVVVEAQGSLALAIDISPINCHDSFDGSATVNPVNGAAPFTWRWQDGSAEPSLDSLGNGSYAVTVTDTLGCSDELAFSIAAPDALVLSASATPATCHNKEDGTATVSAAGGTPDYQYLWSSGQATPIATGLTPGWYSVTVSDENGCSDTTGVLVGAPPALLAGIEAPAFVCFGETATAAALPEGGTPPYAYAWSNGSADSLLLNLPPGDYLLTVSDAHQCTQTASVTIDFSTQIQVLFTIENTSISGASDGGVTIDMTFGGASPYTYLWNNGATSQNLSGVLAGAYSLTVTDADSCQNVFFFNVDTDVAAGERGAAPFTAAVVPNPVSGDAAAWLVVESGQAMTLEWRLYDALGWVIAVRQASVLAGANRFALPPVVASGVFLIQLHDLAGRSVWVRFVAG